MFSLPRGKDGSHNVSLASAQWESPRGVERLAYVPGNGIFFGAFPVYEMWPKLRGFGARVLELEEKVDGLNVSPFKRGELYSRLEKVWLDAQLSNVFPLGLNDDRHLITVAGSRSGKGTRAIIPNLCVYPGSVVCLDPKGENATATAARRGYGDEWVGSGLGQQIFVLDPFSVAQVDDSLRGSLNPLALLDPASDMVVDDAALLAESLVVSTGSENEHWDSSARNLIKGIILYLTVTAPGSTLFDLRHLLTLGLRDEELEATEGTEAAAEREATETGVEDDGSSDDIADAFELLLDRMSRSNELNGAIASAVAAIAGAGPNERGSVLSTARRNTDFLDTNSEYFRRVLSGRMRVFNPDVLKSDSAVTVYLCLPPERMGTHGRWLRLMIGMFLERMQRSLKRPKFNLPVLFLLEEFAALGHFSKVEQAVSYAAGFGVKLWPIIQDISQLSALYPKTWQTFLANAGAVQIFGTSDAATLKYASEALGEVQTRQNTVSQTTTEGESTSAPSVQQRLSTAFLGPKKMAALRMALAATPAESVSRSLGTTVNINEQIQFAPLLRPDEIAIQFARETSAGLLLLKGQRPVWHLMVDYFSCPWFRGLYTPMPHLPTTAEPGQEPQPFDVATPDRFDDVVDAFNSLLLEIDKYSQVP